MPTVTCITHLVKTNYDLLLIVEEGRFWPTSTYAISANHCLQV